MGEQAPSRTTALARLGVRSYEFDRTPEQALELLRAPGIPPVSTWAEAQLDRSTQPLFVIEGHGFTLFKPWTSRVITPEGVTTEELAIGPAITGVLVATARGARLDVRVRKYAPAPAQRRSLRSRLAMTALVVAGFVVATGAHPIALALCTIVAGGLAASVLTYRRGDRERDVRQLLAVVERAFGPHEIAATDAAPHRRALPSRVPAIAEPSDVSAARLPDDRG